MSEEEGKGKRERGSKCMNDRGNDRMRGLISNGMSEWMSGRMDG